MYRTSIYFSCQSVLLRYDHASNPAQVLLEFKTGQHFVFPDGGGNAIITCLMDHIKKYPNCDIHWETEARHLITTNRGAIKGLLVRKKDGLLHEL